MNMEKETESEIFIFWCHGTLIVNKDTFDFRTETHSSVRMWQLNSIFKNEKLANLFPRFLSQGQKFLLFYKSISVIAFVSEFWSASLILFSPHHSIYHQALCLEEPPLQAGCVVLQRVCSDALPLGPSSWLDLPISVASAHPSRKVEEAGLWWLGESGAYSSTWVLWHHLPLSRPGMMEKLESSGRVRSSWAYTHTRCVEPPKPTPPVGRLLQQELISHSPGGWECKSKVRTGCFLWGLSPGCVDNFSPCPQVTLPLSWTLLLLRTLVRYDQGHLDDLILI